MKNVKIKIYAPDIEPRIRHGKIFESFKSLENGETMELINNHDPKPLYYQFMYEHEGEFTWEYIKKGPEEWRVLIGKV